MWYVIISWTTTIISTTQILYYKYYPSHLAPVLLIEEREREREREQQQQQQEKEKEKEEEERVEMQLLQRKENGYYVDVIPLN
jgi:hypothetical protein